MMGLGHEAGVLSGVCLHKAHLRTEIRVGQGPGLGLGTSSSNIIRLRHRILRRVRFLNSILASRLLGRCIFQGMWIGHILFNSLLA